MKSAATDGDLLDIGTALSALETRTTQELQCEWRKHFDDIPSAVSELVDDPYRSLAGELRQAGGFAKDTTPFSEFIWADFLRRRIKPKDIKVDFSSALATALKLAKTKEAGYLPGSCGPLNGAA